MIDIQEIINESIEENLREFTLETSSNPSKTTDESQVRVYKALLKYSGLLLDKYHESLKSELSKHGIDL